MSNIKIEDDKLQTKINGIRHNHFIRASLNYTECMRSIARNDKWNWKFDKSVWCVRYSWKIEEISIGYQKFNLKENFDEKGVSLHCICFEQSVRWSTLF